MGLRGNIGCRGWELGGKGGGWGMACSTLEGKG